jgi:hypothetical protein
MWLTTPSEKTKKLMNKGLNKNKRYLFISYNSNQHINTTAIKTELNYQF